MFKIQKVLSDLGIGEADEALHEGFKAELKTFLELPEGEATIEADEVLVVKFNDLHDIDVDPDLTAAKAEAEKAKADAEQARKDKVDSDTKAAEEKAKSDAENAELARLNADKKAKLDEIAAKDALTEQNKIDLLENKRYLDYDDIKKLGIDLEEAGTKFTFKGYTLTKRFFFLQYSVRKPIVKG